MQTKDIRHSRINTYTPRAQPPSLSSRSNTRLQSQPPLLQLRYLWPPKVLIQVQNNLQRIPTPEIRQRPLSLPQPNLRLNMARRRRRRSPRHRQQTLQNLVRRQRKAELRRATKDAGRPAFPERLEALFDVDFARAVEEAVVCRLAFSRFDLQPGLYDVAGGGEVGGWHAGDRAGGEEL